MRVLLVEDNPRLLSLIANGLAKEGLTVDGVGTMAEAMAALDTTHFAAVILDLGLPDGDGLDVLRCLRERGAATPILVLTARMSVRDRVKGLEQGADDYLGKPFAFEELVARIRALLRRPLRYLGRELALGAVAFDTVSREIIMAGRHHMVGAREAVVLETLLRRSTKVVPKKILEDRLYGLTAAGSANAVEVYVHRLRKQLADLNAGLVIHTIRGVGYLIREADFG